LAKRVGKACTVAHQSASFDKAAQFVHCRNPVPCGEINKEIAPISEIHGSTNEECACAFARERCECRFQIALACRGAHDVSACPCCGLLIVSAPFEMQFQDGRSRQALPCSSRGE